MNNKQEILELLRSVADGLTSPEQALLYLKEEPFEDLEYAKIAITGASGRALPRWSTAPARRRSRSGGSWKRWGRKDAGTS